MMLLEGRKNDSEQERSHDLLKYIDSISREDVEVNHSLDIGARDGHFSLLLAEYFEKVTALDLEKPLIPHEKISCVRGDVTDLNFEDNQFDLVLCAEVLEHIPSSLLKNAVAELSRVSKKYLLIGVPYKQDLRVSKLTCPNCGQVSPPWGHVNEFDENKLVKLFPQYDVSEISFCGKYHSRTNFISSWLMNLASNPYGTYSQEERCGFCGSKFEAPSKRGVLDKIYTKIAVKIDDLLKILFTKKNPYWIHVLFKKKNY